MLGSNTQERLSTHHPCVLFEVVCGYVLRHAADVKHYERPVKLVVCVEIYHPPGKLLQNRRKQSAQTMELHEQVVQNSDSVHYPTVYTASHVSDTVDTSANILQLSPMS